MSIGIGLATINTILDHGWVPVLLVRHFSWWQYSSHLKATLPRYKMLTTLAPQLTIQCPGHRCNKCEILTAYFVCIHTRSDLHIWRDPAPIPFIFRYLYHLHLIQMCWLILMVTGPDSWRHQRAPQMTASSVHSPRPTVRTSRHRYPSGSGDNSQAGMWS